MNFEKLNKVGEKSYLPTKKLSELEIEKKIKITKVKQLKTKFGKKIYVELEDSFGVFLPARIGKFIEENEEEFNKLKEESEKGKIYLQYFGGNTNVVQFGNF